MQGTKKQRKPPLRWLRPAGGATALMRFNGVNQWVNLDGNPNLAFAGDFTVSVFCSVSAFKTNIPFGNVRIGGTQPGMIHAHLPFSGSHIHVPIVRVVPSGAQTNRVILFQQNSQALHHIVYVRRGANYEIYLSGILMTVVPVTVDPFTVANNPWSLGRSLSWGGGLWVVNNGWFWNGNIGHASWYDRALTQDEIRALHRFRGIVPESAKPACVAYYPLQPDTHDAANLKTLDKVGELNGKPPFDGTLVNFTAAALNDNSAYRNFHTLNAI